MWQFRDDNLNTVSSSQAAVSSLQVTTSSPTSLLSCLKVRVNELHDAGAKQTRSTLSERRVSFRARKSQSLQESCFVDNLTSIIGAFVEHNWYILEQCSTA